MSKTEVQLIDIGERFEMYEVSVADVGTEVVDGEFDCLHVLKRPRADEDAKLRVAIRTST